MMRNSLVAAALIAAAVAGGAPQLSAAPAVRAARITDLRFADLHVNSGGCRDINLRASIAVPADGQLDDVTVDIWKGPHYVEQEILQANSSGQAAHGSFYWCPNLDGLGKFRAGPSSIDWHDSTFNVHHSTSTRRAYSKIKEATRVEAHASKTGATVTVTALVKFFSVRASRKAIAINAPIELQKSNLGGVFSMVRRCRSSPVDGRCIFHFSEARPHYFRVVALPTKRSWTAHSTQRIRK